jgi:hypothetical protein
MSTQRSAANEKRQAYYCSREWGLKKEAVHKRSGGTCERCYVNEGQAVHHKTYVRLYNEPLEDLIHLCDACHSFTHGKSHFDPALVKLHVYMAGAIFKDNKRSESQIQGNLYSMNDWRKQISPDIFGDYHKVNIIGRKIDKYNNFEFKYGGPTIMFGHGFDAYPALPSNCLREVSNSEVLFAWIDSKNTIGTVAEISAAFVYHKKVVFVAFKNEELQKQFYFIDRLCLPIKDRWLPGRGVVAPSAKDAWKLFLQKVEETYGTKKEQSGAP